MLIILLLRNGNKPTTIVIDSELITCCSLCLTVYQLLFDRRLNVNSNYTQNFYCAEYLVIIKIEVGVAYAGPKLEVNVFRSWYSTNQKWGCGHLTWAWLLERVALGVI